MLKTIRLSSCISVQGEMIEVLQDGTILIRDGKTLYRGRPIELTEEPVRAVGPTMLRLETPTLP
ncbi:hypothetical protein [Amaricoccus sp.]|uniref:hypothetical protein n=1 Tax=Amaricoccus sp. TaxID=1872485 RepID=UPI001B451874|nr:hypothetical protein [Amaricoccus sp.]MBP7241313.1 hypothetical protein [Amaricoccus sp.]